MTDCAPPLEFKKHLRPLHRSVATDHDRQGFLRLDLNESVEGLPEPFIRKVLDGIGAEYIATYPHYSDVINQLARSLGLRPENVLLTNGSDAAIRHIFEAYVEPGDKVALTDPTFAMYPIYCQIFRAKALTTTYNHDLTFPREKFVELVETKNPKVAVLVNPNNPTGSKIEQPDVEALASLCDKNRCLFVVDEAYFHYLEETAIDLVQSYSNVIVLRTFSKLGGLAGLRVGYAVGNEAVISGMIKAKPTFDVNCVGVQLARAILKHPEVLEKQLALVNEGKAWLSDKLESAGIPYVSGHANFILIDCGDDCSNIFKALKDKRILVAGGFQQPFLKNYIRVTLGGKGFMDRFWQAFSSIRTGIER